MSTTRTLSVTDLVDEVGSLPAVAARIVALTADASCPMSELATAIGADGAMTLRFLALANSAAFSRGQEIRELRGALVRLGLRRVRDLALLMGAHDMFAARRGVPGLAAEAAWRHNLATASWARGLDDRSDGTREDAWLAGILQGVGLGALMRRTPEALAAAVDLARGHELPLAEAERLVLGMDHAQVGAALCSRWGLPPLLAEAVARQGDVDEGDVVDDDPVGGAAALAAVVRLARRLARCQGLGTSGDGDPVPPLAEAQQAAGLDRERADELAARVLHEVDDTARSLGGGRREPRPAAALARASAPLSRLGLSGQEEGLARRELAAELTTARAIQQRLLPEDLAVPGPWEVAAVNRPSRTVSGDIYDVFPAAAGHAAVVVADVCGKGVAAALLAANLQATLRALAPVHADPGALLAAVNVHLHTATDAEHFATLLLLLLPADGGPVRAVSAGHVPPLVLGADGGHRWLRPGGPALGLLPEAGYRVETVDMAPGDRILVCTDGVAEAEDDAGVAFGREGLAQAAPAGPGARTAVDAVLAALAGHAPGRETPADDLTLLCLARV